MLKIYQQKYKHFKNMIYPLKVSFAQSGHAPLGLSLHVCMFIILSHLHNTKHPFIHHKQDDLLFCAKILKN